MSELINIGSEEAPTASVMLGHVPKAVFAKKWSEEWEGDPLLPGDMDYQYAVPPDGTTGWALDQDVSVPGAVPVTVLTW